jgi:hypothetical protein
LAARTNTHLHSGQEGAANEERRLEAMRIESFMSEPHRDGNTFVLLPHIKKESDHVQTAQAHMKEKLKRLARKVQSGK